MAITEWELCRVAIGQRSVKILLCDDDPAFLTEIEKQIHAVFQRLNMRASVSAFHTPWDIGPEQFGACDLAFFDIDFEYEECNGIDVARTLRSYNARALLFFVTNYIDYAPAGYEVQAFRYILKREMGEVLERYLLQAIENLAEGETYLQLRDQEQTVDLPLEKITYIEVLDHYVSIHADGCAYTMSATLSSLEKELEQHAFLRIHKSYLVNMRSIRKFRSRECLLQDGTLLAVSERNYSQQKHKYLLWKGMQ